MIVASLDVFVRALVSPKTNSENFVPVSWHKALEERLGDLEVQVKKLTKLSAHVSPSIGNKSPARGPSLRQCLESTRPQKSRASRFVSRPGASSLTSELGSPSQGNTFWARSRGSDQESSASESRVETRSPLTPQNQSLRSLHGTQSIFHVQGRGAGNQQNTVTVSSRPQAFRSSSNQPSPKTMVAEPLQLQLWTRTPAVATVQIVRPLAAAPAPTMPTPGKHNGAKREKV